MKSTIYKRGVATLELLIALAVGMVMITGATMLSFSGQTMRLDTELVEHGLYNGFTVAEAAAAEVGENWDDASFTSVPGFYEDSQSVNDISPCLKLVGGGVDWDSTQSRAFSVNLETLVGSIIEAKKFGGGCDPFPPSGWDTPGIQGGSDVSPNGLQGTAVATASVDGVRYAFLTTIHSAPAHNDFWVIDTSNPANPVIVAQLNTGDGLNDIAVANDYAYVVQNDDINQLQTLSISNPTSPSLVNTVSFDVYGVDPAGSDPEGRVVQYYDGKLYVGLKTTEGPEFLVFDVSGNPAAPSFVGAISTSFNHTVNDIAVGDNYAFVATGHDSKEVKVIDISGATPLDTGAGFNTNASAANEEDTKSLFLIGDTLYVGLQRTNGAAERDFYVLDVSNPTSPTALGSVKLINFNPSTQISSIAVQGQYAFLGTSDSNDEFRVVDVSNPTSMIQAACSTFNFPQEVTGIKYIDNLVFASIKSNQAFRIMYDTPATCPL